MTAAGQRNRNHVQDFVKFVNVPFAMEEVLYDPQTSGGLLISVSPKEYENMMRDFKTSGLDTTVSVIGTVAPKSDKLIRLF